MILNGIRLEKMAFIMKLHQDQKTNILRSASDTVKAARWKGELDTVGIKTIEDENEVEFEIIHLTQDIRDIVKCAEIYLTLTRCNKCERYVNTGYICIHCGNAE